MRFSKSLTCSIGVSQAHLKSKPKSSWTVCGNILHYLSPLSSVIPGALYGSVIRQLGHYLSYSIMSSDYYAPVLRLCSRRKESERETERNRHIGRQREKGCLFSHVLLWPIILIRSKVPLHPSRFRCLWFSDATTVAYGKSILPLLEPELGYSSGALVRGQHYFSVSGWGILEEKKIFTYHPSFRSTSNCSILLQSVCFCLFWVLKELLHYLSRYYEYIPWETQHRTFWFHLTQNWDTWSFYSYLCVHVFSSALAKLQMYVFPCF